MPITSSSISSSDASSSAAWAGFVRAFLICATLCFPALAASVVALDPYDTGRFALLNRPGLQEQGPRTANASRGRDPAFDGAIIGNSHAELVSPTALTRDTGIRFVSLFVTATGPREQFVLLDYFLARHAPAVRALVFGIDGYWCTPDPDFANWQPFPFWLYDPRPAAYLAGLVRSGSLEAALQRLLFLTGIGRRPRAVPNGEASYERDYVWRADAVGPRLAAGTPAAILNETGRFPQLERLGDRLAALGPAVAVVALIPPAYVTSLPRPGSAQERSDAACREALVAALARHPRSALVDWRVDRPEVRVAENFFDHTHYRGPIAREIVNDVAAALRRLESLSRN